MQTLRIQDRLFESIERAWLINQSGKEPRLVDIYAVRGSEQLLSETDLRITFPECGEIDLLSQGADYLIKKNYKTTTSWRVKSSADKAQIQDLVDQDSYNVVMESVEQVEAAIMNGDDMVRPVSVVSTDPRKNQIQILDAKTVLLSRELCGQEIKMWQVPIVYDEVAMAMPIKNGEKRPICDIQMLGFDLNTESWQVCEIKKAKIVPKQQTGKQRTLQFIIDMENISFNQVVDKRERIA